MQIKKLAFLGFVILSGCATTTTPPPPVSLAPGAVVVVVAKSDPGDNFEIIGPVSGSDGFGCGMLTGFHGSFERATTILRNKVFAMGGTYAQIVAITEPHSNVDCYDNEFSIRATAYKKVRDMPSPTPILNTGEEVMTKKLRELKKLMDDGVLSSKEYEIQKAKLLEKGF